MEKLQIIGNGTFSKFIQNNILPCVPVKVKNIITTKNISDINSCNTYVCSPDITHNSFALELSKFCNILSEKPLTNIQELIDSNPKNLIYVNFHRRCSQDTKNATKLYKLIKFKEITFQSWDPVPNCDDYKFVINNSLSHDFDLIQQITGVRDISYTRVISVETGEDTSIKISLEVIDRTYNKVIVNIDYKKNYTSYVQKIILGDFTYGFDFEVNKTINSAFHAYTKEYIDNFSNFFKAIKTYERHECQKLLQSYLYADELGKLVISHM